MEVKTPFDWKNIIDQKLPYEWGQDTEKEYIPYIINRALSMSLQSVLFANEINKYGSLDKRMQFDFYYHAIPKGKRYDKWHKKEDVSSDVKLVQDYYNINISEAMRTISLLSHEQLNELRLITNKGGRR